MAGATNVNLEKVIRDSIAAGGFPGSVSIPLGSFTNGHAALAAVGAGTVGLAAAISGGTPIQVIQWDDTADNNDVLRCSVVLPADFRGVRQTSVETVDPVCKLYLKLRLWDNTAAGAGTAGPTNDNLVLSTQATFHAVGDADPIDSTPESAAVGAVDYLANDALGFKWYEFDLTNGLTATQMESVAALSTLDLAIAPNEQIAATTLMYLELAGAILIYDKHATIPDAVIDSIPSA